MHHVHRNSALLEGKRQHLAHQPHVNTTLPSVKFVKRENVCSGDERRIKNYRMDHLKCEMADKNGKKSAQENLRIEFRQCDLSRKNKKKQRD